MIRLAPTELKELYLEQRLSLRQIAKLKGCHPDTVRKRLIRAGIERRTVAEARIHSPRRPFSQDPHEKAYLLGFRIGDLHVHFANFSSSSQTIVVACATTVEEQVQLIRQLFARYGRVTVSNGPRQAMVVCYLDRTFEFLLPKRDAVPRWIQRRSDLFIPFFAGYIDAEGCVQVKKATGAAELAVRSGDVKLLRMSHRLLQRLGVVCPPVGLAKRAGTRDKNGPIYRRDYWRLAIYRREALNRLFTLLDPYVKHAQRRHDIQQAWDNVRLRLAH